MSEPWELRLAIDAYGQDETRIWPRKFGDGPQVHLAVRTGPLLVHCLDIDAVSSVAAAWAQAQASAVHLLPAEPLARPASRAKDGFGSAWPVADVVIEGRQKWDVIPTGDKRPYTTISTDWMTVRVHDRPALEANTHAWAGMCALAIKHLPGNAPNYDRLLRNGYDRDFLQRYNREHPNEGRKFGR